MRRLADCALLQPGQSIQQRVGLAAACRAAVQQLVPRCRQELGLFSLGCHRTFGQTATVIQWPLPTSRRRAEFFAAPDVQTERLRSIANEGFERPASSRRLLSGWRR